MAEHRGLWVCLERTPRSRRFSIPCNTSFKPSKSIASVRQSRTVSKTRGWSGISMSPARHVVLAGYLGGKHRRQQVIRAHPLQRGRHFAPAVVPEYRQRPGRVPAPPGLEKRRRQGRLGQCTLRRF